MKRIIDFQVSIGGQPTIIERVEYESEFASREEILKLKYTETRKVWTEALDALKKQIGHDDYDVHYWWWIDEYREIEIPAERLAILEG